MRIKIWCTLGPASLHPSVIRRLEDRGADLFRVNLSHTPLDAVEDVIALVRNSSTTPVCLDTEGAQVRCGVMEPGVVLRRGRQVRLRATGVVGTASTLPLWPPAVFVALQPGSVLSIDFDGALLEVRTVDPDGATAVVVEEGEVRSNKAVTLVPPPALPALTDKDVRAIELGVRLGIEHFALSFASRAEDVALLRGLVPPAAKVIAKIESRAGVRNMDGIISAADAVLIDRGDLSREVPLEHVPFYQKAIVRRVNRWNKPVFVATNLLESMVTNRRPTVGEADDVANTLLDGVHGLVLAAETAVGADPVGTVDMVMRMVRAFESFNVIPLLGEDRGEPVIDLMTGVPADAPRPASAASAGRPGGRAQPAGEQADRQPVLGGGPGRNRG